MYTDPWKGIKAMALMFCNFPMYQRHFWPWYKGSFTLKNFIFHIRNKIYILQYYLLLTFHHLSTFHYICVRMFNRQIKSWIRTYDISGRFSKPHISLNYIPKGFQNIQLSKKECIKLINIMYTKMASEK